MKQLYTAPRRRAGRRTKRPNRPEPVVASSRSPLPPVSRGIRIASPSTSGKGSGKPTDREKRSSTSSLPAPSSQETPVVHEQPCLRSTPRRISPRGCKAFLDEARSLPIKKKTPPSALPATVADPATGCRTRELTWHSLPQSRRSSAEWWGFPKRVAPRPLEGRYSTDLQRDSRIADVVVRPPIPTNPQEHRTGEH